MEVSTGRKGNKGQTGSLEHEEMHRLTGHQLAVTSIDWKLMAPEIG